MPVLFLLGPSGSGKSDLAGRVAEDLRFLHIEIDRYPEGDGIDLAGLRNEWDDFLTSGQAADLISTINNQVEAANKEGAVLSFPSNFVLPTERIEAAVDQSIRVVILYGTGADCLNSFLERERQSGRGLDADHWIWNNAGSYAEFSRPEYSKYRLLGFDESGHRSRTDLVGEVRRHVLG